MDRKEFLKITGLSAASLALIYCLGGCESSSNAPSNIDFTIDLNDDKYLRLKVTGGFVIVNDILIARTLDGSFVAIAARCTHEGEILEYRLDTNLLYCPRHGSEFSTSGKRVSGPARKDLIQYKIEVKGNVLRIYS
ncbi:MAG: Rieske (2Fe-2S) protein [Ignavibacteria bacterium]|nr:Rieske (2Fe-2S) protein [Ignavibacteria bacterium]